MKSFEKKPISKVYFGISGQYLVLFFTQCYENKILKFQKYEVHVISKKHGHTRGNYYVMLCNMTSVHIIRMFANIRDVMFM